MSDDLAPFLFAFAAPKDNVVAGCRGGHKQALCGRMSEHWEDCSLGDSPHGLPTSHFPLPTSHFPLPTSHFPLLHFSLFTFHFPLFTFHFSLSIFHFLFSIFYFSLPTFHFPLGTRPAFVPIPGCRRWPLSHTGTYRSA